MTFDDAWAVAPVVDPAPWATSLPEEWLETELAFVRQQSIPDGHGGFAADASVQFLTVQGHVEINQTKLSVIGAADLVEGPVTRRNWRGFVDWPEDPAYHPRAGDWVGFADHRGLEHFLQLDIVTDPANMGDHCEFSTEAFT